MAKPKTAVKGKMSRRDAENNSIHEKLRNDIEKIPRGSKPVTKKRKTSSKGMY